MVKMMNMNETFGIQPGEAVVCQERLSVLFFVIGILTLSSILIIGFIGNSLVCISMVKCSFLRRTLSNYLVVSLAVSDLMVCVSVLPFDIVYWAQFPRWTTGGYACNMWNSLFCLLMAASVFNLLTISGDRFVAVVYPLHYLTWVTCRTIKIVLGCVWVYSVGVGLTLFLLLVPPDGDYYSFDLGPYGWFEWYLNIVNVLIPFVVMVLLYIKIYVIARHHSRRMSSSHVDSGKLRDSNGIADIVRRELRIAKALGVVVLCFLLCWLPYVILNFMTLNQSVIDDCNVELADTLACWLAYFNSAINPVLYAYTISDFKRAFRFILVSASRNEDDTRSRSRSRSSTNSGPTQRRYTQEEDIDSDKSQPGVDRTKL